MGTERILNLALIPIVLTAVNVLLMGNTRVEVRKQESRGGDQLHVTGLSEEEIEEYNILFDF
jgi:hypothetical protein